MELAEHLAKDSVELVIGLSSGGARRVLFANLVPIKTTERRVEVLFLNRSPDDVEGLLPRVGARFRWDSSDNLRACILCNGPKGDQ
jgi:hypothetical protein